jgi:hypothetical protein
MWVSDLTTNGVQRRQSKGGFAAEIVAMEWFPVGSVVSEVPC